MVECCVSAWSEGAEILRFQTLHHPKPAKGDLVRTNLVQPVATCRELAFGVRKSILTKVLTVTLI